MPGDPSLTSEPPLAYRPATELVAMIRARQLAARELTEHYLARIERLDAPLRSNVAVLAERALQEAAAADERTMAGGPTGPLHGVPVTIKDFNRFAGTPTTMGTRSLAGWVAEADDAVVARLRGAGAIVIGKTNVPEFGTIGHTDTALHGPCATPWDLTCNAGGSSGGAGAGLAAGRCGLAQGSDAGGSIRIPAAVNGLVGLKPARDRVSNAPLLGDLGFGLVTSGALTRTVADAALALDVLAGYEPGDPGQAPPPVRPFVPEVGGDVGRLRIGIDRQTLLTPGGLHASVEAALDATVEVLSGLGHDLEELTLPVPPTIGELMLTVWAADLAAQPVDPSTFEPVNVWLAQVGRTRRAAEAAAAPYRLQLLARAVVAGTSHLDAVVLPVLTGPSRRNGQYAGWDGEAVFADQTAWVGLTPRPNLTGQPSISLPLHHDDVVGPVGVQLVGRPWDEAGLLRLAAQVEAAASTVRIPRASTDRADGRYGRVSNRPVEVSRARARRAAGRPW